MAKNTGTVRRLDELGRVVLPKGMRKALDISPNDELEFVLNDNKEILIRKLRPTCVFCGSEKELTELGAKTLCRRCIGKIKTEY